MSEARRCTRVDYAEAPGTAPLDQPTANGAMVAVEKKAFVFGGFSNGGSHGQIAEYDLATKQWTKRPGLPAARSEGTAVVLGAHVVLFGGWNDHDALAATIVTKASSLAEGKTDAWQPLAAAAAALRSNDDDGAPEAPATVLEPPPRRMHAMCVYQPTAEGAAPCAYVFGGFSGTSRLNDLWRLDGETLTWTHVECQGFPPSPRDSAALAANPEQGQLLVFGGYATSRVNELFTLDVETGTWARQPTSMPPAARFGTFAVVSGDQLVAGMGQDARGASAGVFALKLSTWKWALLPVEGDELEARINFAWCTSDGGKRLIIAGGSTDVRQCTAVQEIELEKVEAAAGSPAGKKK
uniref:Uncharacterized protein n=1 Tax=Neobodo designis TaxID=312471 RepID=A0A7S1R4B0_NEODS